MAIIHYILDNTSLVFPRSCSQKKNLTMQLRSYQEHAIQAVENNLSKTNKQVLVLATGLGKTVIFSHLISQRHKKSGKKALILAHREELLTQAKDKLLRINPDLRVSIEMADKYADDERTDVIVASVATIGRAGSKRLERFDPKQFDTVVIDEAHHASANSYKHVLAYFGVLKLQEGDSLDTDWNSQCLLLGVTATPNRMDNEGIDKIFDEVVYNYGILEGIRDGWLSRIRAYRVDTKTSLEDVHTRAGDFAQDELADAINNPERNNLVARTYMEQFKGKQALVFGIDVAHAEALTQAFRDQGVYVAMITGDTNKEARKYALTLFHEKNIQVVVNCMVLTEGYDNDTIDVIMMARPTKSGILYQQMVGRGTRIHPDKPHLIVCDFVDNTYRHVIKTTASLFGIPGMVDFAGGDVVDSLEQIAKIRELAPNFNLDKLNFDKLDYIMEEVDLISGLDIPADIKGFTEFAWHRYGENSYRIGIGNQQYFVVEQTITGQWKARMERWDAVAKKLEIEELGEEEALMFIIQRTDKYIASNYEGALRLIDMGARWRKDPPSEAQIKALRRLGVNMEIISNLDKGKASQLQTKLYASLKRR
jgi:ATP-dependent helicase IRC3